MDANAAPSIDFISSLELAGLAAAVVPS